MRDGVPTVVLQRRSATKAAFPNLLDVSAGGHILSGETLADGVRELHEEMGIEPTFEELVPLGEFRLVDADPGSEGDNREIIHAYLHFDDRPMSDYRPDPVELSGIAEMALADFAALYNQPGTEVRVVERSLDGTEITTTATLADVVPDADEYAANMLAAATEAAGQRQR